jgi:hypothetical protein
MTFLENKFMHPNKITHSGVTGIAYDKKLLRVLRMMNQVKASGHHIYSSSCESIVGLPALSSRLDIFQHIFKRVQQQTANINPTA